MIIDVKDWKRQLQDAIDKAFPGKQLKVDENTKSITRMVKASLDRRGIAADKAVQQKEVREIIAVLKASDLSDDLGLYIRAFGGHRKDSKSPRAKAKVVDWKRVAKDEEKYLRAARRIDSPLVICPWRQVLT